MLTYTPPSEQELPQPTEKPWLLLLLCIAWLLPGLFGREPLKPDETVIADIVRHILSGDGWLIPQVAGLPFVERAPLFYWIAAVFAAGGQWLGLEIHEAARLGSTVLTALGLWAVGLTGRTLIGRRHGRSAVLILIGCLGLLLPGHTLAADTAVMAAWSLGLLSIVYAGHEPIRGGVALGLSIAMAGLAGSFLEPILLLALACIAHRFPLWRSCRYRGTLLLAMVISLPLLLAWPLALGHADPVAFNDWWQHHALGWFGGMADVQFIHPFGYYLKLLPWFAWPAWPLAAATLWMQRDRLNQAKFQMPLAASGIALLALALADSERAGAALILLPPLALIGAVGLDVLRRGASAFLNWFGVMTFGLLAVFMWTVGIAMKFSQPAPFAARIRELNPGFTPDLPWYVMLFAVTFTAIWLWVVSRRRPMGRQAVTNWAAGITLCWGLFMAFGTDWINRYNGYRHFSQELAQVLPRDGSCVASENLGHSQRAVLHYYIGLVTVVGNENTGHVCPWLLRQVRADDTPAPDGWQRLWSGGRAGDNTERYQLFRKLPRTARN